jgi:3-deoxy-D-manno-oct-2-ulosonic acid (Kdo) hydroxylase
MLATFGDAASRADPGAVRDALEANRATAFGRPRAAGGRLRLRIEKRGGDRVVSALVAGLARLNPLATVLDTSPYDRAMRRLHNYMKDDPDFRADMQGYRELRFPPLSAWMVFTDGVSHASLEGQFALVTTIIVRRAQMRWPERAPFSALLARAPRRSPVHASQD